MSALRGRFLGLLQPEDVTSEMPLTVTPMDEFTAAGQEIEQAIGVEAANSFPEDEPDAAATAALEAALAEADLVEPKPVTRKKAASGTGAQRKPAAKASTARKPKASLAEALAKLDDK